MTNLLWNNLSIQELWIIEVIILGCYILGFYLAENDAVKEFILYTKAKRNYFVMSVFLIPVLIVSLIGLYFFGLISLDIMNNLKDSITGVHSKCVGISC